MSVCHIFVTLVGDGGGVGWSFIGVEFVTVFILSVLLVNITRVDVCCHRFCVAVYLNILPSCYPHSLSLLMQCAPINSADYVISLVPKLLLHVD